MSLQETIIVKPLSNEGRKENGIYIPPTFDEYLNKYSVVKGGTKPLPTELKEGDVIYTRHTNGINLELNGEKVKVINRSEIIAIDG